MTTDLERTFFDTFGIDKSIKRRACSIAGDCPDGYNILCNTCEHWRIIREEYPQITDTHYLELITHLSGVTKPHFVFERGVEELKQDILTQCMDYVEVLKPFVRDMFE